MVTKGKTGSSRPASLRRGAEKNLSPHPQRTPKLYSKEYEDLIDELRSQNRKLRERQEEIEEAGKRYVDLYDFAPIGYLILNRKGTIVDLNLTGARLLGLPRNQLIGTSFFLFVTKEFQPPFNQHLKKVFSGKDKETCELKMNQRYQTSATYVSVESRAVHTEKGVECRSAVIDITERKSAEKELIETREGLVARNVQLERLSSRLLETHEMERSRTAGDVHDSFTSQLCVIGKQLQPLLGKGEDKSLNRVLDQLRIAIRDAIRIQSDLRPPVLDDLGLLPALDMLCREFQDSHSHIHVEKKFLLEEVNVPDPIKVTIYRIAEEAFDNIASHSGADSVSISLARRNSFIEFVIQDNGRGFFAEDMLTVGTGRGLSTMKERAVLSRGLFTIESAPGKGTTLRASWPFS
jgi:PAS domain S-box-containing protein